MASTSETGHAKNVANLYALKSQTAAMGADYNPVNTALGTAALETMHADCDQKVNACAGALIAANGKKGERKTAFSAVEPLLPRILSVLKTSEAPDEKIKDAAGLIAKIRGARRAKTAEPGGNTPAPDAPKTISVSQQSFDMQAQHFADLVALIKNTPEYATNDDDLKYDTLKTMGEDLKARNKAAVDAENDYDQALSKRNAALYGAKTGLYDVADKVKEYMRSLPGGVKNEHYKQAVKLKFTKPAK